eukprot:scpid7595/ scgid29925/ 
MESERRTCRLIGTGSLTLVLLMAFIGPTDCQLPVPVYCSLTPPSQPSQGCNLTLYPDDTNVTGLVAQTCGEAVNSLYVTLKRRESQPEMQHCWKQLNDLILAWKSPGTSLTVVANPADGITLKGFAGDDPIKSDMPMCLQGFTLVDCDIRYYNIRTTMQPDPIVQHMTFRNSRLLLDSIQGGLENVYLIHNVTVTAVARGDAASAALHVTEPQMNLRLSSVTFTWNNITCFNFSGLKSHALGADIPLDSGFYLQLDDVKFSDNDVNVTASADLNPSVAVIDMGDANPFHLTLDGVHFTQNSFSGSRQSVECASALRVTCEKHGSRLDLQDVHFIGNKMPTMLSTRNADVSAITVYVEGVQASTTMFGQSALSAGAISLSGGMGNPVLLAHVTIKDSGVLPVRVESSNNVTLQTVTITDCNMPAVQTAVLLTGDIPLSATGIIITDSDLVKASNIDISAATTDVAASPELPMAVVYVGGASEVTMDTVNISNSHGVPLWIDSCHDTVHLSKIHLVCSAVPRSAGQATAAVGNDTSNAVPATGIAVTGSPKLHLLNASVVGACAEGTVQASTTASVLYVGSGVQSVLVSNLKISQSDRLPIWIDTGNATTITLSNIALSHNWVTTAATIGASSQRAATANGPSDDVAVVGIAVANAWNLTLNDSTISGATTTEGGEHLDVATAVVYAKDIGSLEIHNLTISDGLHLPLRIQNAGSATLTAINITNNTVQATHASSPSASAGLSVGNITRLRISGSVFRLNTLRATMANTSVSGACMRFDFTGATGAVVNVSGTTITHCVLESAASLNGVKILRTFYGGGLYALFAHNTSQCTLNVSQCGFTDNRGVHGGALGVVFDANSEGNHVIVDGRNSTRFDFSGNSATGDKSTARSDADTLGAGGAIAVVFLSSNSQNRFNLSGYRLSGNQASEGGAVYALFYDDERTHRFSVTGCVFTDNSALTGSGLLLSSTNLWIQQTAEEVWLKDLDFDGNKAYDCGALAVHNVQFVMTGVFTFTENFNSALYLQNALCTYSATSTFSKNRAHAGGGIYSISSRLVISPGSKAHFDNNVAVAMGAGIYAFIETPSPQSMLTQNSLDCFLQPPDLTSRFDMFQLFSDWSDFTDNRAGIAGSAVYVNDVMACWPITESRIPEDIGEQIVNSRIFTNNMIIPELYTMYSSWTVNEATPGGSLCQLMRWHHQRWNPQRLVDEATLNMTNGENDMTERVIATDISELFFLTSEDTITPETACIREKYTKEEPLEIHFGGSGLERKLQGYACDQFHQVRDALLYLTVDRHQANQGDTAGPGPSANAHRWQGSSRDAGAPTAAQSLTLSAADDCTVSLRETSATVGLTVKGNSSETGNIAFVIDGDVTEPPKEGTTVTVQVVGATHYVTAQLNVYIDKCRPGYKLKKKEKGGKVQSVCTCDTDGGVIRGCSDTNDIRVAHGYFIYYDNTTGDWYKTICPPSFCSCPDATCSLNTEADAIKSQCNKRKGILCSQCLPIEGEKEVLSVMGWFTAACVKKDDCLDWKAALAIAVVIFICLELLVLTLNIPLANDIKGLCFYQSVVYLLISESDKFRDEITCTENCDPFSKMIQPLWAVANLDWPGKCFVRSDSMADSIAWRFLTPALIFFLLFPLHFFIRKCWMNRGNSFQIFDGTLLLLYLPASHIMGTCMRLLSSVQISPHHTKKFFYDASQDFFEDGHKAAAIVASVMICLLAVFVIVVAYLSQEGKTPRSMEKTMDGLKLALKVGVKRDNFARQWWTVDLIRRFIIIIIYMNNFSEWVKHCLIGVVLLACLLFHIWVQPYTAADGEDADTTPFVSMPPPLRRRHWCNYLEAAVLTNMLLITFTTCVTTTEDSVLDSPERKYVLRVLMTWPTLLYYCLLLWKIVVLFYYKLRPRQQMARQGDNHDDVVDDTSDLIRMLGSDGDRLDGVSERRRRQIQNHEAVLEHGHMTPPPPDEHSRLLESSVGAA